MMRAQQGVTGRCSIAYLNALALQECAKNSNCTLVVSPGGTNVNVQPRAGG